jgi:hypothetical protein
MLVGDEDRRERFRIDVDGLEPFERFLARKSSVDEESSALGSDQRGITGTRRGQDREFKDGGELL